MSSEKSPVEVDVRSYVVRRDNRLFAVFRIEGPEGFEMDPDLSKVDWFSDPVFKKVFGSVTPPKTPASAIFHFPGAGSFATMVKWTGDFVFCPNVVRIEKSIEHLELPRFEVLDCFKDQVRVRNESVRLIEGEGNHEEVQATVIYTQIASTIYTLMFQRKKKDEFDLHLRETEEMLEILAGVRMCKDIRARYIKMRELLCGLRRHIAEGNDVSFFFGDGFYDDLKNDRIPRALWEFAEHVRVWEFPERDDLPEAKRP